MSSSDQHCELIVKDPQFIESIPYLFDQPKREIKQKVLLTLNAVCSGNQQMMAHIISRDAFLQKLMNALQLEDLKTKISILSLFQAIISTRNQFFIAPLIERKLLALLNYFLEKNDPQLI